MSNVEFHHFVDGSPSGHIPLASLGKQNLGVGVLQRGCGIGHDHGDFLTIVVDEFIVILRLRSLHLRQTTQVAGGPRQIHEFFQFGALDFSRDQQEFATEIAQGFASQITTLLGILGSQHLLPQGVLQDFRGGIECHSFVRMEHQRKNKGIVGQCSFCRIESRVGNGHAAGLQWQIVLRVVLAHVLILQPDHGLILFIGVDIQLDQAGTGFNHQRQNAV